MLLFKEVDSYRIIAENSTITIAEELAIILCELNDAGGECERPYDSWQCQQVSISNTNIWTNGWLFINSIHGH